MNLQIRDPRARELAQRIADRQNISMTEAVIVALEAYLRDEGEDAYVAKLAAIGEEAKALAKPGGRDMTKEEIDDMWGH